MTKKDYILVADLLNRELKKDEKNRGIIFDIAGGLIDIFKTENERFDTGLFKERIQKI